MHLFQCFVEKNDAWIWLIHVFSFTNAYLDLRYGGKYMKLGNAYPQDAETLLS